MSSGGGGQFPQGNFGGGYFPSGGMQKGMGQPTDYSNLGGSLGNATYGSAFHPGSSVFSDTILPQTGGSDFSAPTYPGYSNPSWLGSYGPDQHQPYGAGQQRSGGQILNSDGSLYQPPGNIPFTTNPDGTINFGSPPPTGGNMNSQSPAPQMQNNGMPAWLSQFMQSMPQQQQQQAQAQSQPMAPPTPAPLQSSDANVQAYLNQNYMPGIHGGPDPSMLAGSMYQQPDPSMNKVAQVQQPPNPFARSTEPGTVNGPGGLGFTPPGQPTQLFGPTAGLFGGVSRPQGTPNNFGYFPGSGQWGAPNMGWASQWGKQPG